MDAIQIEGGPRLEGEIRVSGSKNAALPILAASLLTSGSSTFHNVPALNDIRTMCRLLELLGAEAELPAPAPKGSRRKADPHVVKLTTRAIKDTTAPYELVKTMRASVLVLGPLVARHGQARVSLPGGCAIGARPIDQHLKGLEAMGAKIVLEHGYVTAKAKRLRGARLVCDIPTVTGTENLMMAASLAKGHSTIENAAREPEVEELARVLNKMGARVSGAGTPRIVIEGVAKLHGARHTVLPDRIETGTYAMAVTMTGGDVMLAGARPELLQAAARAAWKTSALLSAMYRPSAVSISDFQESLATTPCVSEPTTVLLAQSAIADCRYSPKRVLSQSVRAQIEPFTGLNAS